jgi:sigma-B regulation protein RsbU (phosphoserine phosphatase)
MNAYQAIAKILIVDDKPENLFALEKTLTRLDAIEVMQAASGSEALGLTLKNDFALAIVDVQMPEMDGYELVELLRGNQGTANLPVIFVSAIFSDEYHHRKGYDTGAVDFMSKPFNPEILLSKVRVFLDLYRQRAKLQELVDQVTHANAEIQALNKRLESENLRMEAELDVAQQLQQMLLPTPAEIKQIEGLDIAGFLQPATEVGGDYYDVLEHNGRIKIGIGDVTGHGLESGIVALMLQTAICTLMTSNITDHAKFIDILNRTIHKNIGRMSTDKSLSLALFDYVADPSGQAGEITVSGQHEQVIVVRKGGQVELKDTFDLGFPVGLIADIGEHVNELSINLQPGDGIVLYSDGITEAVSETGEFYGLERLCQVISQHWLQDSETLKQTVIDDVQTFIGEQVVDDDITLLVVKQR